VDTIGVTYPAYGQVAVGRRQPPTVTIALSDQPIPATAAASSREDGCCVAA
jgi:hypothetical protein